jgi:hypothetical protein
LSDSKPPPVPRPKPIGRQSSHSPSEIAQAQAVMDDVVRDHISGESPLPSDYETQTEDIPTPDRREATLPRRLADVANALVPARWLGLLFMFLLGIAGGLVTVGVVWGQTVTENRAGVAEAKADAAEAKAKATPVGELKGKLDLTMKKTDEAAGDVKKLATETAAARQDIAVMQAQQTAAHAVIDQKLNDIAADLKVLVRAARK